MLTNRDCSHDWSDEYCINILKSIKVSMGPKSRILICDPVMNTTFGCDEIPAAPSPLPANYGYHVRYCHNRDIGLMATINGIERTPAEFKELFEKAAKIANKYHLLKSDNEVERLRLLVVKVEEMKATLEAEEDLGDVPDEFLGEFLV